LTYFSLERQSLYELVWSKPTKFIATDLNMNESQLITRCVELQIPRPLSGYWRAVAKGNPPSIPPLPPLKTDIKGSIKRQDD